MRWDIFESNLGIIARSTGRVIARTIVSAILPVESVIIPKLGSNLCEITKPSKISYNFLVDQAAMDGEVTVYDC